MEDYVKYQFEKSLNKVWFTFCLGVLLLLAVSQDISVKAEETDRLSEIKEAVVYAVEGLTHVPSGRETEITIPVIMPENEKLRDAEYLAGVRDEIIGFTTETIAAEFGEAIYKPADLSVPLQDLSCGFVMYWYDAEAKDMIVLQMSTDVQRGEKIDGWALEMKKTPYQQIDVDTIKGPLTESYGAMEMTVFQELRKYPGFRKERLAYEVVLYTFCLPQNEQSLYVQLELYPETWLLMWSKLTPNGIFYQYDNILTRIRYCFKASDKDEIISQLETLWGEGYKGNIINDYQVAYTWQADYLTEKVIDDPSVLNTWLEENELPGSWNQYESVSFVCDAKNSYSQIVYNGNKTVEISMLLKALTEK